VTIWSVTLQNKYDNITIALAGIVQALSLVKELAQTGRVTESTFQICIQSIFKTDPENATIVFGDIMNLKPGLEKLLELCSPTSAAKRSTLRQTLAIMGLQEKIFRSPKKIATLTQKIQQAKKQAEYFSLTHPNVLANLGDTYLNAISTLHFRFFIIGNQRFLSIRENIDKIRALLLAAIRAAVLWRQMGGSRLQLLFSHKKIKTSIEKILAQLKEQQRKTYVVS
jgi:high frequency lysogenization protein